jgi:hypothetical protein
MEDEIRKHFRGLRIIVTLSLLAACLSFAFSYVLFKDVSVPLERMRTQELNALEARLDALAVPSVDNERVDVELQMAIQNMKDLQGHASPAVKEQAAKAMEDTQTLLKLLRGE